MSSMLPSVRVTVGAVSAASVQVALQQGCDPAASLTATRPEPSMRLQLKTASTGTSSRSHGHISEPGWWKPAWYGIGEWTREPWLATVTSAWK